MDWINEIKKTPNDRLRAFSKSGRIAANVARDGNYTGATSEIYVVQDDGKEFSVSAFGANIGRAGHRITVVYLKADNWEKGYAVAFHNHDMDRTTYDRQVSGSADGKYDPKLEGPPFAEGCLALVSALVVSFLLALISSAFSFGDEIAIPAFFVLAVFFYILLRKYGFKGGRNRVERINQLVKDELSRANEV